MMARFVLIAGAIQADGAALSQLADQLRDSGEVLGAVCYGPPKASTDLEVVVADPAKRPDPARRGWRRRVHQVRHLLTGGRNSARFFRAVRRSEPVAELLSRADILVVADHHAVEAAWRLIRRRNDLAAVQGVIGARWMAEQITSGTASRRS